MQDNPAVSEAPPALLASTGQAGTRPAASGLVRIEPMTAEHAQQVLAIYQAGIDAGNATFETRAPDWAEFSAARLADHRLVALDAGGVVLGWAAEAWLAGIVSAEQAGKHGR